MMGVSSYCPELGVILEKSAVTFLDSLLVKAGGNLFSTVIRTISICCYNKCIILFMVALVYCKNFRRVP